MSFTPADLSTFSILRTISHFLPWHQRSCYSNFSIWCFPSRCRLPSTQIDHDLLCSLSGFFRSITWALVLLDPAALFPILCLKFRSITQITGVQCDWCLFTLAPWGLFDCLSDCSLCFRSWLWFPECSICILYFRSSNFKSCGLSLKWFRLVF